MASPTLESLAADVERLQRLLANPQALRDSMALTYNINGDAPRIIDENGRTLDYTPNIQFLGGTTTLDAQHQRIIYTATGGGGAAAYTFSDDATPTDAQAVNFYAFTDPTKMRGTVSTATTAGVRTVTVLVAEDLLAGAGPYGFLTLGSDVANAVGTAELTIYNAAFTDTATFGTKHLTGGVQMGGVSTGGGGSAIMRTRHSAALADATLSVIAPTGIAASALVEASTDDVATSTLRASGTALSDAYVEANDGTMLARVHAQSGSGAASIEVTADSGGAIIVREDNASAFARANTTGLGGLGKLCFYGPFTAVSGVVASATTNTVNVAGVANASLMADASTTIMGVPTPTTVDGEKITVSWAAGAAGSTDVFFYNTSTSSSEEADFVFYIASGYGL